VVGGGGGIVGVGVTELAPRLDAKPVQVDAACGFVRRFIEELFRDRVQEIGWLGGVK
jgi:hypothetical protein